MKQRTRNTLAGSLLACAMAMTAIGSANIAWAADTSGTEPPVAGTETHTDETPANEVPATDESTAGSSGVGDSETGEPVDDPTTGDETSADGQPGSREKAQNANSQNYGTYGATVKSYLSPCEDGGVMFVQYVGNQELLAEYYDASNQLESSIVVPLRLPKWGGFYETEDNYFVLTGQNNADKTTDDGKPKFNIAKYDKDWKFLGEANLATGDTWRTFDGCSARMAHAGNYLIIRTGHDHLTYSDGYNHQSNMSIVLDMESMKITSSSTGYSGPGYASHSFNQFIKADGDYIAAVDHGDSYPRGIILTVFKKDLGNGSLNASFNKSIFDFPGPRGDNATGASVGGFEISGSDYLIAGNSNAKHTDAYRTNTTRNVFVIAVDKYTNTAKEVQWLTDYAEGDPTANTPHLVKIDDDHYAVIWSTSGGKSKAAGSTIYYTTVDASGTPSGEIRQMEGTLSDCVPIVVDGKVVWYTIQQDKTATFSDRLTVSELTQQTGSSKDPAETNTPSSSSSSGGWVGPSPTVNTAGEATITFNANGGTLLGQPYTLTRHGTCFFFPTASRSGYIFDGWYTSVDGGTKVDWTSHFDYDSVLYAHWREDTPKEYTATLDANGGTLSGSASVSTVQQKLVGLPQPTRDGYAFEGWYTADGVQVTDTYQLTGDVTLQARWKELDAVPAKQAEYTVTFDATGGTVDGEASLSTTGQKLPSLPDASRDGYTFGGWFDHAEGGTPIDASYEFQADSTVYAQWTPVPDTAESVEKVKIQSVKSPSEGKLKVSWKRDDTAKGYQVAYSKNKSFPASKKTAVKTVSAAYGSKTFSVLSKGKTYYVRVRAYKKVDGKKVYGNWSNIKKITVKK